MSTLPHSLKMRIAPTPSGWLHKGNAFNFLLTRLHSSYFGAELRLRIDDMDRERVRPEYIEDIFRTLDWLGIEWDKGPTSVKEHEQDFSQRLRMQLYNQMLNEFMEKDLLFACECSRKEIQELSDNGMYPGTCSKRMLNLNKADTAWRCKDKLPSLIRLQNAQTHQKQDFDFPDSMRYTVLKRKDGLPAYQICSLSDDIEHGINYIIRGQDLQDSSIFQLSLAEALGKSTFTKTQFYHHPLLTDGHKNAKLSKSQGSQSIKAIREQPNGKNLLLKSFCEWMGWKEQADCLDDIISYCTDERLLFPD